MFLQQHCHIMSFQQAIDSIIVGTKVLAKNTKVEVNGCVAASEASTSSTTGRHRALDQLRRKDKSALNDEEEEDVTPRRKGSSKGTSFFDLLKLKEGSGHAIDFEEEEFQRNLLEEWEQRELRREERDKVKLEILKRIAESMEAMTRKQDEMIDLLKGLK